jgi:hypothetical protein
MQVNLRLRLRTLVDFVTVLWGGGGGRRVDLSFNGTRCANFVSRFFTYLYSADNIYFVLSSLNRLYTSETNIQWEKKATDTSSKYSFRAKSTCTTVNSPQFLFKIMAGLTNGRSRGIFIYIFWVVCLFLFFFTFWLVVWYTNVNMGWCTGLLSPSIFVSIGVVLLNFSRIA